jgi:tRNA pseudouridine38-40 synthase
MPGPKTPGTLRRSAGPSDVDDNDLDRSMSSLRNIRLTIAYDGGKFCGWQVQSNGPSIQAALERAIVKTTGEHSPVYSAGRTDSGVHALGQVANFTTASAIPAENFRSALQSCLPREIVILESCEAPAAFHSTYAARSKHYRYVIDNSPVPLPFLMNYTWQIRRPLDDRAMHAAAQSLLGKHDFRSFETDWPNKVTSVRTVFEVSISRQALWPIWLDRTSAPSASSTPHFVCLDIIADGFLYNMVRSITGTLVNVGRGKWQGSEVERILRAQLRSLAGATAPACGLYLVSVDYGTEK